MDLSQSIDISVDFIKIDVEGAEYEILEANPELLHRVDAIRGELHPVDGRDQRKFLEWLRGCVSDTHMTLLGLPVEAIA